MRGEATQPGVLALAQLVDLFVKHAGFVPGFEFEAEGFDRVQLLDQKLIVQSQNPLHCGAFITGPRLELLVVGRGIVGN